MSFCISVWGKVYFPDIILTSLVRKSSAVKHLLSTFYPKKLDIFNRNTLGYIHEETKRLTKPKPKRFPNYENPIFMTSTALKLSKLTEPPKSFINVAVVRDAWEEQVKTGSISDRLPKGMIEPSWLISYLQLTDNSIKQYRDVALKYSGAYQISVAQRYDCETLQEAEIKLGLMSALGQKTPRRMDEPPFNHAEAVIIIAIARLYQKHGLQRRVINVIQNNQFFYKEFSS